MNEKEILKELKALVINYEILQELKKIVDNAKQDRQGNLHSESNGRYIRKSGIEKSLRSDRIRMHEFNTNLTKEERKKKSITKAIGNHLYTVENHGFNNYKITKKEALNDID